MNHAIFSMDGEALTSRTQQEHVQQSLKSKTSLHESYEDYHATVVQFNDEWRLIECKDDIQWIIQHSKKTGQGKQWRGRSYHRTSESLKRVLRELKIEISPIAQSIIDQLPSRIENGRAA